MFLGAKDFSMTTKWTQFFPSSAMARPEAASSTHHSSANVSVSTVILMITVTGVTTGIVTFLSNSYLQRSVAAHFEELDMKLNEAVKEMSLMKQELDSLKNSDSSGWRSVEPDGYQFQSKYRPLPADFEMFAIGFIIIFFIVLLLMYKGDLNRGD